MCIRDRYCAGGLGPNPKMGVCVEEHAAPADVLDVYKRQDEAMRGALDTIRASGARVLDYEWTEMPHWDDTAYFDGFHLDTRHGLPQFTEELFTRVMEG